jgi:hypothetical protein
MGIKPPLRLARPERRVVAHQGSLVEVSQPRNPMVVKKLKAVEGPRVWFPATDWRIGLCSPRTKRLREKLPNGRRTLKALRVSVTRMIASIGKGSVGGVERCSAESAGLV